MGNLAIEIRLRPEPIGWSGWAPKFPGIPRCYGKTLEEARRKTRTTVREFAAREIKTVLPATAANPPEEIIEQVDVTDVIAPETT